jgi:pimeloyl-ACP methyl ester carboxylesterase
MPVALSGDVPIHYEVDGDESKPTLVLHHGLASSAEDFLETGYVAGLAELRQLILIDGRGHGSSGKPHDPAAYAPQRQAEDVVAVLDDLGVAQADFVGFSMGGLVGWALGKYAPDRIRSYVIGGSAPYVPEGEFIRQLWSALKAGPSAVLAIFESGGPVPRGVRSRVQAIDIEAMKACFRSGTVVVDPLDAVPGTMKVPSLLIVGEEDFAFADGMQKCARQMPNATLVTLRSINHPQSFFRSDLTLPHIKAFLAKVDAQ